MEEKANTINYWGRPRSQKSKPSKAVLISEIRAKLPKIIDINTLTIQDLVRLNRALDLKVSTTEFQNCRTKKEYIAALSIVAPGVKNFDRLNLQALKDLSEVFNDETRFN